MSAYLDERYFDWLCSQVCSIEKESYRNLLHILYTHEFVWLVPNDDNRVEDGRDLRYRFFEDEHIHPEDRDTMWLDLGCSIFEMMVALAHRAEFEDDSMSIPEWFWHMMENIELDNLSDRVRIPEDDVAEILDRVIWRTYEFNGGGGFFPLRYPEHDQRKVELWYQLSAYILERG